MLVSTHRRCFYYMPIPRQLPKILAVVPQWEGLGYCASSAVDPAAKYYKVAAVVVAVASAGVGIHLGRGDSHPAWVVDTPLGLGVAGTLVQVAVGIVVVADHIVGLVQLVDTWVVVGRVGRYQTVVVVAVDRRVERPYQVAVVGNLGNRVARHWLQHTTVEFRFDHPLVGRVDLLEDIATCWCVSKIFFNFDEIKKNN